MSTYKSLYITLVLFASAVGCDGLEPKSYSSEITPPKIPHGEALADMANTGDNAEDNALDDAGLPSFVDAETVWAPVDGPFDEDDEPANGGEHPDTEQNLLPIPVYPIAMTGPVEMMVAVVYAGFAPKEKAATKAASVSHLQTTASPAVGSTHVVTTAAVVPAASVQAIQPVTCSRAIDFEVEPATRHSMPQTTTAPVVRPMRVVSG